MTDWTELFKYSSEHHDGTGPSRFKPVSAEDKKWLEDTMGKFTFNETTRLKQVIDTLKKQSRAAQKRLNEERGVYIKYDNQEESKEEAALTANEEIFEELTDDELVELLEELIDLVELEPRYNRNLCLMGGMQELLAIIFSHQNDSVRRAACKVFSAVTTRNIEVQTFASKSGAINLASQLEMEKTPVMREALIGCLSSFLNTANFEGKRQYIQECGGLEQLSAWICLKGGEEKAKYGEGANLRKIKLKLRSLLFDLVLNDDSIMENPYFVRDTLGNDNTLLNYLLESIQIADLESARDDQLREYTFKILYRIYQRKPDLKEMVERTCFTHANALKAAMKHMPERAEDLKVELSKQVKNLLAATSQPMLKNFDNAK